GARPPAEPARGSPATGTAPTRQCSPHQTPRPGHADPPPVPAATPTTPSPDPTTHTPAATTRRGPCLTATITASRRIRSVSPPCRQQHPPPDACIPLPSGCRPYVRLYPPSGAPSPFLPDIFGPCHRNHRPTRLKLRFKVDVTGQTGHRTNLDNRYHRWQARHRVQRGNRRGSSPKPSQPPNRT